MTETNTKNTKKPIQSDEQAILDRLSKVQDLTLDQIRQAQAWAIDATDSVVHTVSRWVPEWSGPSFAEKLPEPKAVVDQAFDFASELLQLNRTFAERLAEALSARAGSSRAAA